MIRYTKVPGLELGPVGNLPRIQLSEDGKRIGHIPGWNTLLTPSHIKDELPRNRVVSGQYLPRRLGNPMEVGTFANGTPSFYRASPNDYYGQTQINKGAWTFFAVVRVDETLAAGAIELLRGDRSSGLLNTPRIGFNSGAGSFVIFEGSDSNGDIARLTTTSFRERTALVMATYSEGNGVKLFDNGVVGAENGGWGGFSSEDSPGSYSYLSGFRGDRAGNIGHIGLLDVDLSIPKNLGHRRSLERYMSELYGISEIS